MGEIKAFVGHSFTDDDEQVVTRFLKIFDQIKAALPTFEWVNAKQAEPEELAKKVLRLTADCNTFIAICTKKELTTRAEAISRSVFRPDSAIIKNDRLEWKTSDWIIQEIGLAVGRSMATVVLLENGCRRPGGLQGDVEFIPFDRDAPEKAFGPILEMVRAVDPPAGSRIESSPDHKAESADDEDLKPASGENEDDTPEDDWTTEDYESAFVWKMIKGDTKKADEISEAFHASKNAASAERRAEWDARCEDWRLRFSDKGSLSNLKRLHDSFPDNLRIRTAYASALSFYSKHEESAELYEAAAASASAADEILSSKIEAAIERAKAGQADLALELIDEAKDVAKDDPDLGYSLSYGISRYAEATKNEELRIEAMERIVWLRPDDDDVRFSLAYAHSEAKNNDVALHHYLAISYSRRNQYTWNNLGVLYQNFSVPARAIAAFETAAADGNTLAMSNLAYRFLQVGFVREAREQLDKALRTDKPHKNVNEAYAALNEMHENETKAVEELLESSANKIEFFKKLGQAICEPDIVSLDPQWRAPDCDLSVRVDGRRFEARGRYNVKGNALSGLLGASKSTEYEVTLAGDILGRRVFGQVERKSVNSTATSLLGDATEKKHFAMIFDAELKAADVIESINTRFPRCYQIQIAPQPPASEAE